MTQITRLFSRQPVTNAPLVMDRRHSFPLTYAFYLLFFYLYHHHSHSRSLSLFLFLFVFVTDGCYRLPPLVGFPSLATITVLAPAPMLTNVLVFRVNAQSLDCAFFPSIVVAE